MINSDHRLASDQCGRPNSASASSQQLPEQSKECCCWSMPSVSASNHDHNLPPSDEPMLMDTLTNMGDNGTGTAAESGQPRYTAMESQSSIEGDEMTSGQQTTKQLVPVTGAQPDFDDNETSDEAIDKGHLQIPEIIETLKNLAACKEKLFKWEQSVANLESIPDSDPNKSHLMEIIDFVENTKSSTKEKAIYLYEQLGLKCRQHKNYIGAAKAFERAASLRLDISDLNETGDNKEDIVTSTIRYLESAIDNYDAIHKFKHAGTLHYRCSRILKMMNASHEEVDKHHEKALEYFTKPDHELKHRKRIDGLKISCYSSYSTLARMHHEIEKFTHTTTTTTTNTIKFHADGCYRDSEDSDSNHSTTPPPSSSGSANGQMTPAIPFYGEDRHDYHNQNDFFDSFMADSFFDQADRPALTGDVHATSENGNGPASSSGATSLAAKGGSMTTMTKAEMLEKSSSKSVAGSRLHHSSHHSYAHHESMSAVKDHHHHYHHHHMAKSASAHRHLQTGPGSSYSYQKHHKATSSSSSTAGLGAHSPLSAAALHASQLHKTTFRCIEDRIESARKLVKKLHKLCPFYEVSTNGDDAGRVYCRICDRYLGAVSSTLKNHINTQEHRQAYEDSQQPSGQPGSSQQQTNSYSGPTANAALPAPHSLPALPAPPAAAPTTSTGGQLTSYQANPSTATSRGDLVGVSYSSGGSAPNCKPSYSNDQLILQPGVALSPFMIQANPISYQTLDSALQKSHLSGKYMDFDLGPGGSVEQQNMINTSQWAQANANSGANYGNTSEAGSQRTPTQPPNTSQYLFSGSNGASLNMAAAVLMQSNLSQPHPHYAIPASVSLGGNANSGNANTGASTATSQNMPVLAYQ